jgi:hypothetical protein
MGPLLAALLRWFLGVFTRLFALAATHFGATKIIFVTLFVVILPIIINNILYDLMDYVFTAVQGFAGSQTLGIPQTIQFAGLAGYFLTQFGLVDAFAVILSCMAIRFAMSWIPFVGPK